MKLFRVTPPDLPVGLNIVTINWFVNTEPIFDNSSLFMIETTGNITEIEIPITFDNKNVYYGFVSFNLSDGTSINSDVVIFSNNEKSSVISDEVYPPILTAVKNNIGDIVVTVSDPKFFYKDYIHYATSYSVRDTSGNTIYTRNDDYDNLNGFTIPKNIIGENSVLIIEAKHELENLNHNNWGRIFFINDKYTKDVSIMNNVLYKFSKTELVFVYDLLKYRGILFTLESLSGKKILENVYVPGTTYTLDPDIVRNYTRIKIKIDPIQNEDDGIIYEKILRVVDLTYINPNNNHLPYSLPFALGA